jgi:hypothetical protein
MYEPLHDELRTRKKNGDLKSFVWVVEIGPIVKIFPSEQSADRYLSKNGFELSDDCTHYVHKYKSEDQKRLDRLYKKH